MKNYKLHLLVLILVIIAEFIGTVTIPLGFGSIILLPMLFAMVFGLLLTMKPLRIANEKDMKDAGSLVSITLLLLMAKYGTNIGPTIPDLIASSPALILQEFGNIGTVFLGVPLGLALGMGREVIGAAHSIGREPNVALIADKYGLDSPEGEGVLGVYIVGTVLGTILISLLASILATVSPLHPYSLAMAAGVGSASMMTAVVGTLAELFPDMTEMLTSYGTASNVLSGLDGVYMSLFISLPLSEWMYRKFRGNKESRGVKNGK
ncbi:MAG: DUF3100 domain-containing protein [Tissierellia bacterium]|nr:DUF3100 domain-containing protein [Bacillota bacterium]NLK58408.1 DUF3100 domain-containing protein [Tissierellia bacterium]